MLGRNPTFQDLMRLTLLAPDFLEARGRFVAQGLKPYGREQSRALLAGATAMYVSCRIINQAVDQDPHWDKPFSVVYNSKEYRLRTAQGDLEHLVRDPWQFAAVRLNPTTTKPPRMIDDKLPVYGITRVTRHPRLCGVSLWAIAHLLVNGNLAAIIMFGVLLVTAVNGMVSIDRKRRRALGGLWDEFAAQTARLPFAAILAGRTRFEISEFRAWQIALAVVLFAGVFWLHGIVGSSPLWALH